MPADSFRDNDRCEARSVEPKERIKNFDEFHIFLSKEKQREQAARCMTSIAFQSTTHRFFFYIRQTILSDTCRISNFFCVLRSNLIMKLAKDIASLRGLKIYVYSTSWNVKSVKCDKRFVFSLFHSTEYTNKKGSTFINEDFLNTESHSSLDKRSASIGQNSLSDIEKESMRSALKCYACLTVREDLAIYL